MMMSVFRLGFAVIILLGFFSSLSSSQDFLALQEKPSRTVKVVKILSVDRIQLESGEKIKLIGLKGPALPRRKKVETDEHGFIIEKVDPIQSVEEKALTFVTELLEGQSVRIETDVKQKDADFSTLAYVFLIPQDILVNEEILRQGFAQLQIVPPNMKYEQRLRQAYLEARKEMRGFHGE